LLLPTVKTDEVGAVGGDPQVTAEPGFVLLLCHLIPYNKFPSVYYY
jgi:hypothetical protein